MVAYISFIIIFLHICTSNIFATEPISLHEIKKLFLEQKYQHVLSALLEIKNKNSAVYMLIASCYEQLGHITLARAYLEKAYMVGSYAQKIKILEKLHVLQGVQKNSWFEESTGKLYCFLTIFPMILLQIIFLLLIFLLLYIIHYRYQRMLVSICIAVTFGSMIIKHHIMLPRAITLKEAIIYSAPENMSPSVGKIAENNIVYYTEQNGSFYKIETPEKKRGWIQEDELIKIV